MTTLPVRSIVSSLVLAAAFFAALTLPASAQNLATRRLIDAAKKDQVPKCEAAIKEKTGAAIPVEVDFASFGDKETHFLSLQDVLQGVSDGFAEVAKDAAGKEAVAAKVKKITLTRDEKGYGAEFKDGVLMLRASFVSNFASPMADKVKSVLEETL